MNDIVEVAHFHLEKPLIRYPSGIWIHMQQILSTQRKVEEIIKQNHGVLPIYSYQNPDIHTNYIRETDNLIGHMHAILPLIKTLDGQELQSMLAFIREGILFYRMRSPILLQGYILFLEDVLRARDGDQTLSPEDREEIETEIEYFRDLEAHYE